MTHKLYYEDATLRTFTAQILATRTSETGMAVQLDQTAFYPTGGGQPHDTGTLNAVPVLEVWEDDTGNVWHSLVQPLPVGAPVTGQLNWERRCDHTQQHTGQHLLSAACLRRLNAATTGFHLGAEIVTIDLDIAILDWDTAHTLEDEVNHIIWENRPVTARWIATDAPELPALRKTPAISGPLRVITVAGCDQTACGGTHVAHTGEIGLLKITGLERYKGGMRVTFLCGRRALADYRRGMQLLHTLNNTLTVGQAELPDAVKRLQIETKELRRALRQTESQLHTYEAAQLWEATPTENGLKLILQYWPERDFEVAQTMATVLQQHPRTLVLLATGHDATTRLVCARSDDLAPVDASALLRQVIAPLGGRGGGTPTLAQGGVPKVEAQTFMTVMATLTQRYLNISSSSCDDK